MRHRPRVLVIDDSPPLVQGLVRDFKDREVDAEGCEKPWEILGWHSRSKFEYDLILLDMQLDKAPDGTMLSALNLLPHLVTYAPTARIVVITAVADLSVKDALRCIELGALAVLPKGAKPEELCRLAEVYEQLGSRQRIREELIDILWQSLDVKDERVRGQRLEMLMINLFESMPTFRVVGNNVKTTAGSVDVLVENKNQQQFWTELSSPYLAIECKDRKRSPEPQDFNQLGAVVKSRRLCGAGVLVSMSSDFRQRRGDAQQEDGIHVFGLGPKHVEALVRSSYEDRDEYLRSVLEQQ